MRLRHGPWTILVFLVATIVPLSASAEDLPPLNLPSVGADTLAFTESFAVSLPSFSLQSSNSNYRGATYEGTGMTLGSFATSGTGISSALSGYPYVYLGGWGCSSTSSRTPCVSLYASMAGTYQRTFESVGYAYDIGARLQVSPSMSSGPETTGGHDRVNTFSLSLAPTLDGEVRWYPGPQAAEMFLFLGQSVSDTFGYTRDDGDDYWANAVSSTTRAGVGWGRVLSVGVSTRLRKLVRHLEQRGALSGPVTPEVGNEILRHWYALRNEFGWYSQLAYLEQILRRHGLLARPLDLEEGYVTVAILQDAMLEDRRKGWRADVSVAFLEDAWQASNPKGSSFYAPDYHHERLAVDLSGRWVSMVGLDDRIDVPAVFHVTPRTLDDPFPWLVFQAEPQFVKYFYSRHEDPVGRLTVGAHLLLATAWGRYVVQPTNAHSQATLTQDVSFSHPVMGVSRTSVQGGHLTAEVGGSIQYSRNLTRGSSYQVGFNSGLQKLPDLDPGYYLGLTAGVTFGVAKGSFARY